jgi:hypothetical protein
VCVGYVEDVAHLDDVGGSPGAPQIYPLLKAKGPVVDHYIAIDMHVDEVRSIGTHDFPGNIERLEDLETLLVEEEESISIVDDAVGLGAAIGEQEQDLAAVEVLLEQLATPRIPDFEKVVLGNADDVVAVVEDHAADVAVVAFEGPGI